MGKDVRRKSQMTWIKVKCPSCDGAGQVWKTDDPIDGECNVTNQIAYY